jgi:hypothetical protein
MHIKNKNVIGLIPVLLLVSGCATITKDANQSVQIDRSSENLLVNCEKEGEQPGKGTVVSRVNGGMFGNIVFGGGIGAIIDHNKGTAYTYPSWIRIIMGDNLVYDRKHETENQPVTGIAATGQEEAAPATTAAAASTTAAAPAQ